MIYFNESDFKSAEKQRKKMLAVFFITLGLYVVLCVGFMIWYRVLPYRSPVITTVKAVHYSVTGAVVIFLFVFLGIPFKRVNRFYKLCKNLIVGIKETSTANFFEYDETVMQKDGVDFKSLVFLEWNKYKKDYFERKVLVFSEKPFPEIPENAPVTFITQGNVLISYEIGEIPAEKEEDGDTETKEKWYKTEDGENNGNVDGLDKTEEGEENESDSNGDR